MIILFCAAALRFVVQQLALTRREMMTSHILLDDRGLLILTSAFDLKLCSAEREERVAFDDKRPFAARIGQHQ
jgi:hypothetical protein